MSDSAAQLAQANRLLQQRSYQEAIQILAGIHALLKQPEQAKTYLDRLLPLVPQSGKVHLNAARNALALNLVELSIGLARKAVELAPQDAAGLSPRRRSLAPL